MARDDWRIRIELEDEHAHGFLERLGLDMCSRAKELAQELKAERLPATRDGDTLFVYASSGPEAERAQDVIQAELEDASVTARALQIEHWLDDEDRWDDEPEQPDVEEELVSRGFAPWEVRVDLASHEQADALSDQLESEGFDVVRRWTYLIIGTNSREEANALAERVHGEVEAGGELVWEVMPHNPFAVFGGLGG